MKKLTKILAVLLVCITVFSTASLAAEGVLPEEETTAATEETTAPAEEETTVPVEEETTAPAETEEPTAPQTFDFGVAAAVTAIVSAAGYALTKKRK